jgi:hypothetical protein
MQGSQNLGAQPLANVGASEPSQNHGVSLRRRNEPGQCCDLGPSAKAVLTAFNRVIAEGKSETLLLWPQRIEGIAVFHALAALGRIATCDREGLATLFFPWNRNSGGTQRTLLVDRDQLVQSALPSLNRVHSPGPRHPAVGYLMAIHSLKHLSTGEQGNRRQKALQDDPGLLHPTLFEIIPQAGIQAPNSRDQRDHFLQRLRHHTWIDERSEHIQDASDPSKTPFFLFGAHPDALSMDLFRRAGLGPDRGGRRPDLVLIDLTHRPRNALGGNWKEAISRFCSTVQELYGAACPPALAVTDEVFALQTLRWKILNDYDARRGVTTGKGPARSHLILNSKSDVLDPETVTPGSLDELSAEVYGAELLNFVDSGLKLKRSLLDAGDHEIASSVTAALIVLQNLIGLPGPPKQFLTFLADNYQGYERQSVGSRFDHLTPRGQISSALKLGGAGANHSQLAAFLDTYDKLCSVATTHNPGAQLFDDYLCKLTGQSTRSIVTFSSDLIRAFAEWRIENESTLADVRSRLGREIIFADSKEATEELARANSGEGSCQQILFVEPSADQFLHILTRPYLPRTVVVLCHLARAKQILQRAEVLLQLDGVAPVEWNLLVVQEKFQQALSGHTIDIPDLDTIMLPPRIGTIDLTGPHMPGAGPTRIIQTSGHVQIRAFDGTELAVYEPDALQQFSRRLAKDLQPGDQICVFSPDFVDAAREKLHLSATAPEVLTLYHKTVAEAAARLPGRDLTAKADALRHLILKVDPSLSLPGPQSIRQWIDVVDLVDAPRDEVRPQAPRDRRHYLCFMKALGIAEDVARHYWDWGIFWTRSMRIRSGNAFHQVFMGVLIDPYGAVARLPEAHRQEVWRIYETAEQHVVAVTSNDPEGNADESR